MTFDASTLRTRLLHLHRRRILKHLILSLFAPDGKIKPFYDGKIHKTNVSCMYRLVYVTEKIRVFRAFFNNLLRAELFLVYKRRWVKKYPSISPGG